MKTNTCEREATMRHNFRRLGDARQAILGETKRAVTPLGGPVVLVEFWRELGLPEAVRERLPFACRSANAIGAARSLFRFGYRYAPERDVSRTSICCAAT